jgi:transcription termination factor NusB
MNLNDEDKIINPNKKNLLYLCTMQNCNNKYKTKNKLIQHVLKVHEQIIYENDIDEPIEITKDNKKHEVEKHKKNIKAKEMELLKLEIEHKKQLELNIKQKIEQDEIDRITLLEQNKLRLQEEEIYKKSELLEFEKKCLYNSINNSSKCCICDNENSNTAIIPCGHKFFCYECINSYSKNYPLKGCPICRQKIISILKIFE